MFDKLSNVSAGVSNWFGDGTGAYLSLKLGEKKNKEASKGVANGILLSIIVSIVLCVVTLIFLPWLLDLFGATDKLKSYALSYGYIIGIGLPFMMIGTTLNSIIRADGNPKYSMLSMLAGAVLNIILDPIFIFVFDMGVQGAAIATIISQFLTFIINILYIRKFKTISLSKEDFKLSMDMCRRVSALGISSFITQMSVTVVIAVTNNLLGLYGDASKFGSEIPITVLGIVMKINQILNSIIIGVAVGSQPIFGYNFGAGEYDRVKQTLRYVLTCSVIISTVAFVLFQTIPDKLILIFGSGNELYMEFACLAFRINLMLCILNSVQIVSGIFFQSIGKSGKSAFLSLSRQILFLIPAMFILGHLFGLKGVLYSAPVADGLAFLIAFVLLIHEVRHLANAKVINGEAVTSKKVSNKLDKHFVITVSREFGSGGRYVGKLVAEKLGINLYDKEFVMMLAKETGLSEEYIENNEQRRGSLANLNNGYYFGLNNADDLFASESKLIKEIADKESCVIIGRCADFILKDRKDVIKVFVYSDMKDKIKRATEIYGMKKSKAQKEIKRIDKLRAIHYKYYTEKEWNNHENYDICINSDTLGVKRAADLICEMVKDKL